MNFEKELLNNPESILLTCDLDTLENKINLKNFPKGILKKYNFKNLKEIVCYFQEYKTFLLIHGINKHHDKVLCQLASKVQNILKESYELEYLRNIEIFQKNTCSQLINLNEEKFLEIKRQFNHELSILTVRSRNLILSRLGEKYNLLEYVSIFINYWNLRNAGIKSILEIKKISTKIGLLIEEYATNDIFKVNSDTDARRTIIKHNTIGFKTQFDKLSQIQKLQISEQFDFGFNKLSQRSKNTVLRMLNNRSDISTYIDVFIETDLNPERIKNAGIKTIAEINFLTSNIKNLINSLEKAEVSQNIEYVNFISKISIQKRISVNQLIEYEKTFQNFQFPLFNIFINHFINSQNFKPRYLQVLNLLISSKYDTYNKFKLISCELNSSSERIRRLEPILFEQAIHFFQFEENFSDILISRCGFKRHYYMEIETIKNSEKESCYPDINNEFFELALITLFSNTHLFIRSLNFNKNIILVEKNLFDTFDFDSFNSIINSTNQKDRKFDHHVEFNSVITKFLKKCHDPVELNKILDICKVIINKFYSLKIYDEKIIFQSNKEKQLNEYLFEILERVGRPCHIDEIYTLGKELFPNKFITHSQIRNNIRKNKQITFFGRSSVYGLKKWEKEGTSIKSGTIRNIVEELLFNQSSPTHISLILKYVNQFRASNEYSVIQNLKLDKSNKFILFGFGFIGLKAKKYSPENLRYLYFFENASQIIKQYYSNKQYTEAQIKESLIVDFKMGSIEADIWFISNKTRIKCLVS